MKVFLLFRLSLDVPISLPSSRPFFISPLWLIYPIPISAIFYLWHPPPDLVPLLLFSPLSLQSHLPQVDYRTEDGTANAGSDYEFAEGTLLFKPGETLKGNDESDVKHVWHFFKSHVTETCAQIAEVICSPAGQMTVFLKSSLVSMAIIQRY